MQSPTSPTLKGTRNIKGNQDIELLKLLDDLLNNIPQKLKEPLETPEPRVEDIQPAQQEEEELTHPTPMPEETSIILMPTPRVQDKEKETQETNRILLKMLIQNLKTNQVQIPQQNQIQLCRSDQLEQAQLKHDKDTGEWLT
jgi:hypothetical protein